MGIFLGIVTMLTQFELTLFALFASYSRRTRLDGDGLVASFSFFLFILYVSERSSPCETGGADLAACSRVRLVSPLR